MLPVTKFRPPEVKVTTPRGIDVYRAETDEVEIKVDAGVLFVTVVESGYAAVYASDQWLKVTSSHREFEDPVERYRHRSYAGLEKGEDLVRI